jgi:hypothetical protein
MQRRYRVESRVVVWSKLWYARRLMCDVCRIFKVLERTWLYGCFDIFGTVSHSEALQMNTTQPVVLQTRFRYSSQSTTKLDLSFRNGSFDAARCKVGLAGPSFNSPQLRFVASLPPHRRPIPHPTLAGCSSTPLLPSLLALSHLQLRQCMRV